MAAIVASEFPLCGIGPQPQAVRFISANPSACRLSSMRSKSRWAHMCREHRPVVRRSAGLGGLRAVEAGTLQIEFFDEGIDATYRVVLGYEVVKAFRQQRDLPSILSLDESLCVSPPEGVGKLRVLAQRKWWRTRNR
jgi:hypothetical protein